MAASHHPKQWPGFDLTGSADLLDEAEAAVCGALDEEDLLGTAREERPEPTPTQREQAVLRIYLSSDADAETCAHRIEKALGDFLPEAQAAGRLVLTPFSIPDEDWATLWKDFFRPVQIGKRLLVLPAWWDEADGLRQTAMAKGDAVILRMDPGRAFGSGTHATTQLALRFLESNLTAGPRVLDYGSGSGILSFAAASLGAGPIIAVEIDEDCIDNFRDNARLNHKEGRIDYRIGSVDVLRPDEKFDLIICNVLFSRVKDLVPAMLDHLAPQGLFVFSGFLISETAEMDETLQSAGFEVIESLTQEEWGAALARHKDN